MKKVETKNKTVADLQKILDEKKEALHTWRVSIAGSKVRNMKEGKNLKKEIARILTALKSN